MRHAALLALLVTTGCAGPKAPATHYAGEPFDLAQRGERITGQVCGMDLTLDVTRRGDAVALSGFIDGRHPVHLTAQREGDTRVISGGFGTSAGDAAVDLRLATDKLVGRVGFRQFDLGARGDDLAGTMLIAGALTPADTVLSGRGQLATMPLDTQAALLPALLTCNVQRIGLGRSSLLVRVGGAPGALPHQSSSVYTRD